MPDEWKDMGKAMETAGAGFTASTAETSEALAIAATSAALIVDAIEHAAKAQTKFNDKSKESLSTMDKMGVSAGKVGKTIFDMSVTLLKFASFGAIIGGIGTVLGGFGLADLAGSVLGTSKTAAGLGVSPGELKSWQINMQRYAGTGILQGASEAQIDPQKWGYLGALGISPQQAQNESPADLAMQIINASKRAYAQNPNTNSAQFKAAHALGESPEDWRNIGTSGAGLSAAEKNYKAGVGSLGWDKRTSDDWANFSIVLDRAEGSIEKAFIQGLEPLTVPGGPLDLLATNVSDAVKAFMQGPGAAALITDFGAALKTFGTWLGSPDFQADMKSFATNIGRIAHELYHDMEVLHIISRTPSEIAADNAKEVADEAADRAAAVEADKKTMVHVGSWLKKEGANVGRFFGGSGATRPERNNNPFDLNFMGQDNSQLEGGSGARFAQFQSLADGIRAASRQLDLWASPGTAANRNLTTIDKLIPQLAPGSDGNNVAAYESALEKALGIKGTDTFNLKDNGFRAKMIAAIAKIESGKDFVSVDQINKALGFNPQQQTAAAHTPLKITVSNSTSSRLTFAANTAAC